MKESVMESGRDAGESDDIIFKGWDDHWAIFEVGSGNYVFSSNGFKKINTKSYAPIPKISDDDTIISDGKSILVEIFSKDEASKIYYTLDGSIPDENSLLYSQPLEINTNTILQAKAYLKDHNPSMISRSAFTFVDPKKNGISWHLYEGAFIKLPDFDSLEPIKQGITYQFSLDGIDLPETNFALQMESFIEITKDGEYEFYISSNDGSKLYIDNQMLIDNDGEHGPKQLSDSIYLKKGIHPIRVEYFQSGGSTTLLVSYRSDDISYGVIPANVLFFKGE